MITEVKLSQLVATDAINARPSTKDGLDELAASIAAKGLIQPLAVRPMDSAPAGKPGSQRYEVIDGRRRFQAMTRLVKDKRMARDAAVPVLIRNEDDGEALETSLMANTVRLPMHPVDQHDVFARLAESSAGPADIATRFGISERTVRQHMALGKLAPVIRDAWRKGKIDADVAQAFAANPSHGSQAEAYEHLKRQGSWGLSAASVRRELTRGRVPAAGIPERTLALYIERGGTLTEDLFEDARYVDDALLLSAVRRERAVELRGELEAEGWGWVSMADDLPHDWRWNWDRLEEVDTDIDEHATPEEAAEIVRLNKLANATNDDAEIDRLDYQVQVIEQRIEMRAISAEDRARAGAVIVIDSDGVSIARGIIRPDGSLPGPADAGASEGAKDDIDFGNPAPVSSWVSENADEENEAEADLRAAISGALTETITEAQSAAIAEVLAGDHHLALCALIAALETDEPWRSPVKIAATGRAARQSRDVSALISDMVDLTVSDLVVRLASIVATAVDVKAHHHATTRDAAEGLVAFADANAYLAAMRRHFAVDDYFARVPKATALAAIEEMHEAGATVGLAPVDVLAGMKKAELATAAAEQACRCGWLPPQLRHPAYAIGVGPGVSAPEGASKDLAA